jgi:hypothetical protein
LPILRRSKHKVEYHLTQRNRAAAPQWLQCAAPLFWSLTIDQPPANSTRVPHQQMQAVAAGKHPTLVIGPVEEAVDLLARILAQQAVEELRR